MPALTFKVNNNNLRKKRPALEEEGDDDRVSGLFARAKPVEPPPQRKKVRFNDKVLLPSSFLLHKWALQDEIAESQLSLSEEERYERPRPRSSRGRRSHPKHAMPSPARAAGVRKALTDDVMRLSNFKRGGLSFDLILTANELQVDDFYACLHLIEKTSGDHYRASSIGWNEDKKEQEMGDRDMIYLLIRQNSAATIIDSNVNMPPPDSGNDGKIVGFISFMFTFDDPPHEDREVVYIYEVHLEDHLRGLRIGRTLMKFVEIAAQNCNIGKTMLTVFTANKAARLLYETLGYTKDECSPKDRVTRKKTIEADYVILSKSITQVLNQDENVSMEE